MVHPVEAAVAPLKIQAMEWAEKNTKAQIVSLLAKLAEGGWDLQVVAPYPRSTRLSRNEYLLKVRLYNLYQYLTDGVKSYRTMNDPDIRKTNAKKEAKIVKDAVDNAAAQYETFVMKLVRKIGDCDSASLEGSHVWGFSILTVTKGAVVERWKTQQITNVSKLGLVFPQWPSRLMK